MNSTTPADVNNTIYETAINAWLAGRSDGLTVDKIEALPELERLDWSRKEYVVNTILYTRGNLRGDATMTVYAMLMFLKEDEFTFTTQERIGEILHRTRQNISRCMGRLVEYGFIESSRGRARALIHQSVVESPVADTIAEIMACGARERVEREAPEDDVPVAPAPVPTAAAVTTAKAVAIVAGALLSLATSGGVTPSFATTAEVTPPAHQYIQRCPAAQRLYAMASMCRQGARVSNFEIEDIVGAHPAPIDVKIRAAAAVETAVRDRRFKLTSWTALHAMWQQEVHTALTMGVSTSPFEVAEDTIRASIGGRSVAFTRDTVSGWAKHADCSPMRAWSVAQDTVSGWVNDGAMPQYPSRVMQLALNKGASQGGAWSNGKYVGRCL